METLPFYLQDSNMSGGNPSSRSAPATDGSPDCPEGGGGSADLSNPRHGQPDWYGSNGRGSGGAGPFNVQHVGYPSWYVANGESSAGSMDSFHLQSGYDSYGADRYSIGGGGIAVDQHAAGMSGGGVSYGGGANDGGWCWNGGQGGRSAVDWRASGYGADFFYDSGSGSASASLLMPGMYQPQHARTAYWPTGGSDSAMDRGFQLLPPNGGSSFPLPRIPTGMSEPQHPRTDRWNTGVAGSAVGQHFDILHGNGNGRGGGDATFPSRRFGAGMHEPNFAHNGGRSCSPLLRCKGHIDDDLIANSLRALTVADRSDSHFQRGRRRMPEFWNHEQALLLNTGDQDAPSPGLGLLNADPYAGMRLEDVRGRMSRIATDLPGCQFLVQMVKGGAAAAQQVFDEVAGDVVWLMVHSVGHALVEELVNFWTDEEITRVLGVLGATSAVQIVAAARNHAGSSILQKLAERIAGQLGHVESVTRTLAGVGDSGVLSLIEGMSGSQLILKCLDMFSADQNLFITDVVVKFPYRVCLDRHGCHVFNRCIDKAGDEQTRASLIHAVCRDGLALAEHGAGNYVVQHVIESVPRAPWAKDILHRAFRGRYVSLSRQKASSHVVQRCLQFFSRQQADEIVCELLRCEWHCAFHELISDPFANYVLQTAMESTEGQLHNTLLDAIGTHKDALREDRYAKQVLQKLCTLRRSSYR